MQASFKLKFTVRHGFQLTPAKGLILAFDPGETTGCASAVWEQVRQMPITGTDFDELELEFTIVVFSLNFWEPDTVKMLHTAMKNTDVILHERYRIYPSKAMIHIGSEIPPVQIVGVLNWYAELYNKKVSTCYAATTKPLAAALKRATKRNIKDGMITYGGITISVSDEPANDHEYDALAIFLQFALKGLSVTLKELAAEK